MIRRRGDKFQADVTVGGKRTRKSFDTKADAEAWEASVMPATSDVGRGGVDHHMTIGTLCETAVDALWGDKKQYATARVQTAELLAFIGPDTRLKDISLLDADRYVDHLRHVVGNSNATINRKLATFHRLLWYAGQIGVIRVVPTFRLQHENNAHHRCLSREEETALFDHLESENPRYRDFAIFLVDTGCRFSEALKLTWALTSIGGGWVKVTETKADNDRQIWLTARAKDCLTRSAGNPRPFSDINRWQFMRAWRRAKVAAGLSEDKRVTPHVLRHTCCSRLVAGGMDFRRVQAWMGHKSIATTLRYAWLAPDATKEGVQLLEAAV